MTTKRKAGRPKGSGLKITDEKKKEILAVLTMGGSRNIAADYVSVGRTTLLSLIDRDAQFSEQVKKAEAMGQIKHLQTIDKAKVWQASAWMLERKWPQEFGRNQQQQESNTEKLAEAITMLIDKLPN